MLTFVKKDQLLLAAISLVSQDFMASTFFSGVIINIVMLIMTARGVFDRRGHYLMIEKAGLYWHFVDLVWVFVFLCFYLI